MIDFPDRFYLDEVPEGHGKKPISVLESRKYVLRNVQDMSIESLERYFEVFDIPQAVINDPEIRKIVAEWIDVFQNPTSGREYPKQVVDRVVASLKKLFPERKAE